MAHAQAVPTAAGRVLNPLGWVPVALGAWLAVFGTYEVVERTLLRDANPSLLHVLHILRGTGTSFLLAGLVAWYILRRTASAGEPANLAGALRAIVAENESRELSRQAVWIIRLRWLAVGGVLATVGVCHWMLGVVSGFSALALALIATAMAGYNVLFARLAPGVLSRVRTAFAQVFLDLASLTLMINFTGGVQNPFFLFYIFHIVIAGILLGRRETYIVAGAACIFFCGMAILQKTGLLPSYPLALGRGSDTGEADWVRVAGILAAFVVTALSTAYFTTTIMDKLRRRGVQILEASELLTQERAKTEDIVRSIGAGLLVLDREDRVLWANDTARQWFGTDLPGREAPWRRETAGRRCAGAGCSLPPANGGACACEQSSLLRDRQRFFLTHCSPIRGADGGVDQVLMLVQDITSMKQMEIQVIQSGKMAAVGQLAAGIAHEINNPLAIVAGSAEILSDAVAEDASAAAPVRDALRRHLRKIEDNVYRCKQIIQSLLAFARREDEGFEEVDLPSLLDDTLVLVESSARAKGRRIVRAYRPASPDGTADPTLRMARSRPRQIQQVTLNLLMNALDAAGAGGVVTLEAAPRDSGVEIAVADTGPGIAPEHRDRLFEPFFTTKPVGQGTGLGLYLCHQFVEALRGRIGVESRPGQGATFRVWLPVDSARSVAVPEPAVFINKKQELTTAS